MNIPETKVMAMSVLIIRYPKFSEMIDNINNIPQLKGIVVGVSKEKDTHDFGIFKETLAAKERG